MSPVVSVIMPAYNISQYIAASINSVLDQTFDEWELIIINDGSTDNTEDIARSFASRDQRIVYHKQSNKGVAASRNEGLRLAKGELIAFLDADDLWHPMFLEEMVAKQKSASAECVFSQNDWLLMDGRRIRYSVSIDPNDHNLQSNVLLYFLQKKLSIHICSIIVRKNTLIANGINFTEGCIMGEDTEFKCKLIAVARLAHVSKVLMTYRQRINSITQQRWKWKTYIHSIHAFERGIIFIIQNYKGKNQEQIICECHRMLDYKIYRFLYMMVKEGYYKDIIPLMGHSWNEAVRRVSAGEFGMGHMLKAKLILGKSMLIWRMFAWCSNLGRKQFN